MPLNVLRMTRSVVLTVSLYSPVRTPKVRAAVWARLVTVNSWVAAPSTTVPSGKVSSSIVAV